MVKSARRPKSLCRSVRQSCRAPVHQKKAPLRKYRSQRIQDRGWRTKYHDRGDELESVIAYFGGKKHSCSVKDQIGGSNEDNDTDRHCSSKKHSCSDKYQNDGSHDDNDAVTSDNDRAKGNDYKIWKSHHDKNWVPKSNKKDQMHDNGNDLDSVELSHHKHTQGVIHRRALYHSYDDEDDDNRDHDHVIARKHAHNVSHNPQKIAEDCYHDHHNSDDHDPDATHGHSYLNSAGKLINCMDEDYPQTKTVGYVRKRKRFVNSLHGGCNKGRLPRDGSKNSTAKSHLAKLDSLWSKEAVFPSWKNKRARAMCTKQEAGEVFNVQTSPTNQLARPHETGMFQRQEEPLLPTHPNPPAVSLTEGVPTAFAESELTSNLHSDAASTNQPSNTINGAKGLPPHPQEETTQDKTENGKSRSPLTKPKQKKYQPKVLYDVVRKAKSTPRNNKKKAPAQEGDGPQTNKPKRVPKKRQAMKGQNVCDSTTEPSTKSKKQHGRKQERQALSSASTAFKDDILGTESSCTVNAENSLVLLQSSALFQESHDQESQNSVSQNLTVRDVAWLPDWLAHHDNKAELSMHMHTAIFTPELMACMLINEPCLYGQFFGKQVPHFTCENQLTSPREQSTIVSIHSKPDGFTQQLLTEEPHNPFEMVVYQKREVVLSKPVKSRVKIRARVQLDAESERMWPLLVSGGIPTEFEDASHWERETPIMEKHVRLFIHNMQDVQGDRHFSPWKGSILDSVVGAFLTQNVSDHLSSSAFMSVAARYPSKQRNDTEITNLSDETLNRENYLLDETLNKEKETALEMSSISYGIQSGSRNMHNISSGFVVEEPSSRQQEDMNGPSLHSSVKIQSSYEILECTKQINHDPSVHGVQSFLRNGEASQPIEMRWMENKTDFLLTPTGISTAIMNEDSVKQCGMQPLNGNCMEQIFLEQCHNSSSNLNHTYSKLADIVRQRPIYHLDSHLVEGNVSIESKDIDTSVDNDKNITADSTGQMGSEKAFFHLPTKQDDTPKKPKSSHNGISTDNAGQVGMQNLKKLTSQSDRLLKSCSNSILGLGYHDGTSANHHIEQNGMQHLENPSQSLMEEGILNESSDNGTSSLSLHHYKGQVDLQHLDSAFPCSEEANISMNQCDPHGNSIFVKQNPRNCDDNHGERFNIKKNCSLSCTRVRCDNEAIRSPSKVTGLVDNRKTNTLFKKVGHSITESSTFEQSTFDGSWSPDSQDEVYSKTTVCRSLFQDHVSAQIDSTALINSTYDAQASILLDTSHTENHLAVIQEGKQMASGSDNVHNVVRASPVSTTVCSKRRQALGGIERARLEESQHGRKKNHTQDWESMRRQTLDSCSSHEKACEGNLTRDDFQDSVDWDAVRRAPVEELAKTIKERGMHHVLSGRIKAFLKTLHEDQGNMDLEWLRKVSPENAKAYLKNIRGLGIKSVECIRLLTLHHVAFPVDVNVGRICVRLGWVPIEPLPEQLQLHLLELYPVQETIQKFLWPRLCMLDQKTLYELHYQLITFGKVFCTKSKPNCNACPMRTNCKHFASAYASAKLLLTGPDNEPSKRLCSSTPIPALTNPLIYMESKTIVENIKGELASQVLDNNYNTETYLSKCQHYYVEEPASPEETREPEIEEDIDDIEDIYRSLNDFTKDLIEVSELQCESINGYSSYTHKEVNKEREQGITSVGAGKIEASCFTTTGSYSDTNKDQFGTDCTLTTTRAACSTYKPFINNSSNKTFLPYKSAGDESASDNHADVNEGASKALVSLPEGAYIPAPKLKNIDRLRTVHYVYELPDDHPLLKHADVRDIDDPSFYLLAIWSPGEAPDSVSGMNLDNHEDLSGCNQSTNANKTVSGTLLIPCRTAMRGRFPLNGTYFQVNEVFADHESSLRPIQVPRSLIWKLQRRFVYFGTSISSIFRGLTLDEIRSCFLRGYVCVRGFDRKYKTPRPLVCELHFPKSKQIQRHKKDETETS